VDRLFRRVSHILARVGRDVEHVPLNDGNVGAYGDQVRECGRRISEPVWCAFRLVRMADMSAERRRVRRKMSMDQNVGVSGPGRAFVLVGGRQHWSGENGQQQDVRDRPLKVH
jgi:hypothetical protein